MEVHLEILFHLVLAHDNSRNVVRISRFNQGFIASTGLLYAVSVDKFLAFTCLVIQHHVSPFDSSIPTEVRHKNKIPPKVRSIRVAPLLEEYKTSHNLSSRGSSCGVAHTFHWLIVLKLNLNRPGTSSYLQTLPTPHDLQFSIRGWDTLDLISIISK